jgi:uncharacterized protein YqgC (DUF456 family)
MVNIPLLIISSLLMLVGLFGIIVPFVPGVPLVWLGFFIYAIGTGFHTIPIAAVVIFFVLMAITLTLDFIMPLLGLKKYKASNWSLLGSFLGFIIGVIFFNIWGVIFGPIVGAFLGELIAKGELKRGLQAALATILSSIVGSLLKIVVSLVMIGYFIWSFFA